MGIKKVNKNFCRPGLKDDESEQEAEEEAEHFSNTENNNSIITYMRINLLLHIIC